MKLFKQILLAISITSLILFTIPETSFSEVVFTPLGEITSGLSLPEDVAVSPDRKVYVVDGSQNKVSIYDANNQPIGNLSISKPTSVAVNTDGTIYIGTNQDLSVKIYDASLNLIGSLGVGADEFKLPRNIAVDKTTGNVYVIDQIDNSIKIYTASGTYISKIDDYDNLPQDVTIENNEIIVVDHPKIIDAWGNTIRGARIMVFDMNGNPLRSFGEYGDQEGQFVRPAGIASDADGVLYITDSFHGIVYCFDINGVYLGVIHDPSNPMSTPMGIALGVDRRLFVASLHTSSIHIFGLEGYSADSDDDGILDGIDNCPDTYNPDQDDSDDDGTGDACDDCQDDPLKTDPGVCGCGVADTDSDSDGTPDCNDGCPSDPDKTEPGICGCGVLDTDTDGDGTLDCYDNCPDDPDKTEPGLCGCGVVDSATDTDGDGTIDCNDGCPDDPDKTEPGLCGCGVVDSATDTDGDGTPDCSDGCPDDPGKVEPGVCGCGIADTDSDSDGTPDCTDNCPLDPNKIDPGICGCGVSDADSDDDGIVDCNDGCPNDPLKTEPGICGCGISDDTAPDCEVDCSVGSNSYDFDSSSSHYVSVPDDDDLTPSSGMSVCAWVKPESLSGTSVIVAKDNGTQREYLLVYVGSKLYFFILDDDGGANYIGRYYDTAFATDRWYYVCGTWDGTTSSSGIDILIDCVAVDDSDINNGSFDTMGNTTANMTVGWYASTSYFDGKISKVGLWSSNDIDTESICEDAMENSYTGLATSTKTNLISWWDLDEDTDDDHATACGGGGCNGTAQNGVSPASPPDIPETDCNEDLCLDDPNKTDPGICGCGVADTDTDSDGTPDCNDGCPDDPNKTAPGICGCGVADTDSDGDGAPDCNDLCPSDPNKVDPGVCGCGVADTDSDADGIPDCNDNCPSDPNKINPGICGCGVADTDSDADGTPDCNDLCPNDPNKTDPGVCGCGIPDTDLDGDGTPDCNDLCPTDPNKVDPGVCGCGVADTDSDADGIPDCNDNCPSDPNKINPGICGCGVADTDSDADGTPDCNDLCPNDPNKTDPGVCGCGIPDTDLDGDGNPDCDDLCPTDPNKVEPGICGCGIPDTDSDGDGTPDCNDLCPTDPNKVDPGVCGCGVADTDSDADGTPDCNDNCPSDPNKTDPGVCGCGVADTDTDGDGTLDCNDGCPDDPNKVDPGICGCGVADTDSDSDGTPDCSDGCPDDPGKVEPGICGCGVPDTDTDGDGTPDCTDNCPSDPGKTDPGICGCGVADTDSDGDGTLDCNDGCPSDPLKIEPGICGCGISDDTAPDCNADCSVGSNSYDFESSSSHYISVGDDDDLTLSSGMSVCAWVKPESLSGTNVIVAKDNGTQREYLLVYVGSKLYFFILDDNGGANYIGRYYDTAFATDQWYYVCGTWDGTTSSSGIDIFIDCVAVDDSDINNGSFDTMGNTTANMTVGWYAATSYFDGKISKVGLWSSNDIDTESVCEDAMENSYAGLATSTKTNLISWWDLDVDTDDDHAVSCGGGGCNGIAQNGVSPALPEDMPETDCSEDLCPGDPNKTAPGVCGCGVPDTDSDGDGIPDCNDSCPDDPNKTEPGDCGCGVADTDTNENGIPDCNEDLCPDDPDKTEPGICGCGVADTDSDGDGTSDCNDGCPSDPDKVDPGICGCGVADTDSDGDGTPDCNDGCPSDPDKVDPGICGCGVADTDSDGDGTRDCNDGCPNDPDKTEPGICGCGISDDTAPDCNADCSVGSNSYDFESSSSHYISVGDDDDLTLSSGMSVCAWVKPESLSGTNVIVAKDNGTQREYLLVYVGSKLYFFILDDNGGANYIGRYYDTAFATDQWYYVCGTWDGTTSSSGIDIFIDCVAVDDSDINNGSFDTMGNTTANMTVGWYAATSYFDGKISKVGLWSSNDIDTESVCEDAMENSYAGLATSTKTNLISWWDLDVDTDDDHATSCGGGGCNGTAQNGVSPALPADMPETDCSEDLCPSDPNKVDPGVCGCGTPDTDSDSDDTPDCNDGCPADPNKTDPGDCGCGVADTDANENGIPDCNEDLCPDDPNKTEPGICGCGVAETDSDDDGTPDCNDNCPSDPNKTEPGICGCGVPDTDTDGDGTPDCTDNCPSDPGKTDPGICGCGVADTDSDGDGTLDCNDGCPSDPLKIEPGICGCGISDDTAPDCNADCSVGSNSYDFESSSSHYISVGDDDDLTLSSGMSVCAWVKPESLSGTNVIVAKDNGTQREYLLVYVGSKLYFFILDDNGGANYIGRYYDTAFATDQWYYVCGTWDGTTSSSGIDIFIDCVAVDDSDINNGSFDTMGNTTANMTVGWYAATSYFDGKISKVGLWSSNDIDTESVCEDAMENSYAGLATSTKTNLISWWDLDVDTDDDHAVSCVGGGCNGVAENGVSPASPPDMPDTCVESTSARNVSSYESTDDMSLKYPDGDKVDSDTLGNPNANDSDCNGIDDNGDGIPDNNYIPIQKNCGLGVCESIGQVVCQDGSEVNTCEPGLPEEDPEATCDDGVDNDCDGLVDIDDQSCSPYIYVEPQGICGGNWPCYSTIQAGINAAGFGSAIKVAQGTYYENIVITEPKEIILLGGWDSAFTSRIEDPTRTVIDADLTSDGIGDGNVFFIVTDTNERMDIFMEGFVIRNGYATTGGGISIHAYNSSSIALTLTNNAINSNNADAIGGGIYIVSDSYSMVSAALINSTITTNNADQGGGLYIGSIESSTVTVDIANTVMTGNTASTSGGDIFIHENDMYGDSTTVVNASHSEIGNVYLEGGTYNNSQAQ